MSWIPRNFLRLRRRLLLERPDGLPVVTAEGYDLGKVIDMMETGSNDVLVIKANLKDAFGIKERLVPFLDGQVIKKVDLATRTIEVDWDRF